MKYVLLLLSSILLYAAAVGAEDERVTPYGDYCTGCAVYGACKTLVHPDDAVRAMDKYYRDRGYRIGMVQHRGRFVEAVIFKNERPVDRVLLDRKTGRLRSMY